MRYLFCLTPNGSNILFLLDVTFVDSTLSQLSGYYKHPLIVVVDWRNVRKGIQGWICIVDWI